MQILQIYNLTESIFINKSQKYILDQINRTRQELDMLLNSPFYLCQSFKQSIAPCSPLYEMQSTPKNFHLTSNKSFLFCDIQTTTQQKTNRQTKKTVIKEFQIDSFSTSNFHLNTQEKTSEIHQKKSSIQSKKQGDLNKILKIDQIDGAFTTHAFTDESVLFLNLEGDFYYYNLLNKNVFLSQKQHPGIFKNAQILTLQGHFLTCGGCVKNPLTGQSQRIIKVWKINEDQDILQLKTRINTGHSKSIQNSFLLNNKVVTLSSDNTIRLTNLSTESVENVIHVNQDLRAGCNLDYNTIIVGGIAKQLKIYDTRTSKAMFRPINIPRNLFAITKILRFNDNNLILSNINQLFTLDLRQMKLTTRAQYDGQRISEITVINKDLFVVGNQQKTMQIWKAF